MKFNKLVEFVSKKPIPPHTKHLVVEVMVSDEDGEDVEVRHFLSLLHVLTAYPGAFPRDSCLSEARTTVYVVYIDVISM